MSNRDPSGDSDTVDAVGKATEYIERARGHIYAFHQLIGRADFLEPAIADAQVVVTRDTLPASPSAVASVVDDAASLARPIDWSAGHTWRDERYLRR